MHIIHLAAEFSPIAKIGGLGDVVSGLSKALVAKGEKVEVILPFYDHIDRSQLKNCTMHFEYVLSFQNRKQCKNKVWITQVEGVSLLFIEPENNYFKRGVIYGEEDDHERFIYFAWAALEYLLQAGKKSFALHLHDWHTALAAFLYYEKYCGLGLEIKGIVTTIHNIKYQGICYPKFLSQIGLHLSTSAQDQLQDHTHPHKINLLKGALIYSDMLTTVSPSYAEEIKKGGGFGLESFIKKRAKTFRGIVNGIDTQYWNPQTDPCLKKNYLPHMNSIDQVLDAKRKNREVLNQITHIENHFTMPLFVCITRLVHQKGPEMIKFGVEYILKQGGQFILLASACQRDMQKEFDALEKKYKKNPHVYFDFVFNEKLAHLSFAAADSILIPSLFEPCGLTQMIALSYGTIPIVHKVGGLKDTIFDIDDHSFSLTKRNGYTFDLPSNDSLRCAIDRAFKHYKNDTPIWRKMMINGFSKDWSWAGPATEYFKIYRNLFCS